MMRFPSSQRGATLLVGMIMLVLLTLLSVTAFRLGKGNLQIVGNMQQRSQALSAAQGQIENTISSTNFTSGTPTATTVAITGAAGTDISVTTTPTCVSVAPIPAAQLDLTQPDDVGCVIGSGGNFGVAGVASNASSLCANQLWDINAVAADTATGAQATINEGATLRVASTAVCP